MPLMVFIVKSKLKIPSGSRKSRVARGILSLMYFDHLLLCRTLVCLVNLNLNGFGLLASRF